MGTAYARRLHDRGYRVVVHDIDAERTGALADAGCEVVDDVASLLLTGPHAVLLALPSDDALLQNIEHLCRAAPHAEGARPVVVDTGTSTLDVKEVAHARHAAAGMTLLDCPVSGTGGQASEGDLGGVRVRTDRRHRFVRARVGGDRPRHPASRRVRRARA